MSKTFIVIFCIFLCCSYIDANKVVDKITLEDKEYLQKVYEATFRCITHFVHTDTGLPYDVSDYRKPTSISNIGLYLASLAIGYSTGLIPENEVIEKINKTLTSLEKIDKWHGFPITWVNVETLQQEFGSSFSYADHVANLVCCLLVVDGIFPEKFRNRISNFIQKMNFSLTYCPKKGWLKGGYDTEKKDFCIKQPWGDWYYNLLASDTRHFSLLGIALKQIPKEHWEKLLRDTKPWGKFDREIIKACSEKSNVKPVYYAPGMEGGGLFMQYLPGIFLPEKKLPIGQSARNFAKCQIEFSRVSGYYPLWGWSASESPDGSSYLGWASLKKSVVTPHASVLAVEDFPKEVVENLRALEKHGMRPLYKTDRGEFDFGFTDSYDIESGISSRHYLILDQAMIFLSIANFLHRDIVRKSFARSKLGKKVVKTLIQLESKKKFYSDKKH